MGKMSRGWKCTYVTLTEWNQLVGKNPSSIEINWKSSHCQKFTGDFSSRWHEEVNARQVNVAILQQPSSCSASKILVLNFENATQYYVQSFFLMKWDRRQEFLFKSGWYISPPLDLKFLTSIPFHQKKTLHIVLRGIFEFKNQYFWSWTRGWLL
jgi:hypothetical protein